MTNVVPSARPTSIFGDDEPVIQSHALLPAAREPDARVPIFGDTEVWDFNGVVRCNANLSPGDWRISFKKDLGTTQWNLTAREVAMIMANPRHERVIDTGVYLQLDPFDLATSINTISLLRRLAEFGRHTGLPDRLDDWRASDVLRYSRWLHEEKGLAASTMTNYIVMIKRLHQFGPALSCGVLTDPWPGKSARKAAKNAVSHEVATPAVPPQIWFPLVRAAWAYVHTFAPDVLRAHRRYEELHHRAITIDAKYYQTGELDELLDSWLANTANRIPLHPSASVLRLGTQYEGPNWNLLSLFLGFETSTRIFHTDKRGRDRRARVLQALERGHPTTNGLIDDLTEVTRPDGTTGPWHPGLDSRATIRMLFKIRDAAFCLVAALSMMRDSEIHEIRRGSVVEHYNAPAIASTLDKGHRGHPGKHWWITEPVAEAITVAEAVSIHAERVFAPLKRPEATQAAHGDEMVDSFIAAVNAGRAWTGLEEIPAGRVRPHMFRKTMAMLTDQFPGSEIALGMQLKHFAKRALANRSTLGYAAADVAWAELLDQALDAARFRRLKELFGLHKDGKPIGFGPGAERVKDAFDEIIATVQARGGDARVEEDLLQRAHITIRFGVLNNCLFDENNPAGAVCIENAVVPAGHTGPLNDRCRPDRCRNSMIGVEHVPLHDSHRRTQLKLLEVRGLPAPRRALIQREIDRVDAVLEQVRKTTEAKEA